MIILALTLALLLFKHIHVISIINIDVDVGNHRPCNKNYSGEKIHIISSSQYMKIMMTCINFNFIY